MANQNLIPMTGVLLFASPYEIDRNNKGVSVQYILNTDNLNPCQDDSGTKGMRVAKCSVDGLECLAGITNVPAVYSMGCIMTTNKDGNAVMKPVTFEYLCELYAEPSPAQPKAPEKPAANKEVK